MDEVTAETTKGLTAVIHVVAEATRHETAAELVEDAPAAEATALTTHAIAEEAAEETSADQGATRVKGGTDVLTTAEASAEAEMKEASLHAATAGIETTVEVVPDPTEATAPSALEAIALPATKEATEEDLDKSRDRCRLAQPR